MKTGTIDQVKTPARARNAEGGLLSRPASWWRNSRTFLSEVRNELKRVTWPSRREVYATTFVLLLTWIFFGVYLYGIDLVLAAIVNRIFLYFGAA